MAWETSSPRRGQKASLSAGDQGGAQRFVVVRWPPNGLEEGTSRALDELPMDLLNG